MTLTAIYLALGFLCGAILASATWAILLYTYSDQLTHRIRYKKYVLPCPACRDEDDKPTGLLILTEERSPALAGVLRKFDVTPTFDCGTCDGTKYITYEFPRHEKVNINERQILEGPEPSPAKPTKGGKWRRFPSIR